MQSFYESNQTEELSHDIFLFTDCVFRLFCAGLQRRGALRRNMGTLMVLFLHVSTCFDNILWFSNCLIESKTYFLYSVEIIYWLRGFVMILY